jgi:hypothetical protein
MREVRKVKAKIICILVMTLLIASVAVIPAKVTQNKPVNVEINKANVEKIDATLNRLLVKGESYSSSQNIETQSTYTLSRDGVFDGPGDQRHPDLTIAEGNRIMAAGYHDELKENITTTWSTDYGQTWDPGVIGNNNWDYPTGEIWEGSRGFATSLCPLNICFGGMSFILDVKDPTNPGTWFEALIAWCDYGWYNNKDVEIACDNSRNDWEYGVLSYVWSTTYDDGYTDAPSMVIADPDTQGYYWMFWLEDENKDNFNGSAHTDVDIDLETHLIYNVWDWYNETSGMWELIVFYWDFTDPLNDLGNVTLIKGNGNLQYPSIQANNDKVIVLAETDENGNKDIICYYSDDGANNFQTVLVADSGNDESYPNVCHVSEQKFYGTYIESNNLFGTKTIDGGANWDDTRWQINDNDGAVVEEYKSSRLSNNARVAIWEEMHDDIDCYFKVLYNDAPEITDINGPASGPVDTPIDYTFTAIDPDDDDISFFVKWGDGKEETIGPFESGVPATINHTWDETGNYVITAKAIDGFGGTGPEGTFTVTIPRSKTLSNTLFYQIFQRYPNIFPIMRYLLGL